MEMPQYGSPQQFGSAPPPQGQQFASAPQGPQQSGVVGADVEQGHSESQQLPPRPQQARAALRGMVDRFRR
jgi:hypothetical protein